MILAMRPEGSMQSDNEEIKSFKLVKMDDFVTLGIDIGGSHITSAAVNLGSRDILPDSLVCERINSQGSLPEIMDSWTEVIKRSSFPAGDKRLKLGIAMPGPFDYEEGISLMVGQNKYDALYGINVKQQLSERLGISPRDILMMNDASSFLKGEVYGGVVRDHKNVIGLTIGTGLGTARYNSSFTYDAELWCYPFLDSIVEDYISTRWFVKKFEEVTGLLIKDVRELTLHMEVRSEISGIFEEFGENLGNFLAAFIRMESPEAVVLGGNISKAFSLFIHRTKMILNRNDITVPILQSTLGENAAIIGAASLWID